MTRGFWRRGRVSSQVTTRRGCPTHSVELRSRPRFVKSVPSASMLKSGSLVLIVCSKPSKPYRSAGENNTCCAGVWGTSPVVTPAVGGGSDAPAPSGFEAKSAAACAACAAAIGGPPAEGDRKPCGASSVVGAVELGGRGDEAELASVGVPFGRRPAGKLGVCWGLADHVCCCCAACGRSVSRHDDPRRRKSECTCLSLRAPFMLPSKFARCCCCACSAASALACSCPPGLAVALPAAAAAAAASESPLTPVAKPAMSPPGAWPTAC